MEVKKTKKRIMKKISAFLVAISLCMSSVFCVSAESLLDVTSSLEETDADYSSDTSYSRLRGNNLNFGTTSIGKVSSMEIEIDGITQCHHECDEVYLYIYLERKQDGVYSTYKYWEFVDYNVSNLTREIRVIVPSGYYYRVRGYHAAKDGSKEATRTLTGGILVN